MEDKEMLERLAHNPHYEMTPRQKQALAKMRRPARTVRHNPKVSMHSQQVPKHDTQPPKEAERE